MVVTLDFGWLGDQPLRLIFLVLFFVTLHAESDISDMGE